MLWIWDNTSLLGTTHTWVYYCIWTFGRLLRHIMEYRVSPWYIWVITRCYPDRTSPHWWATCKMTNDSSLGLLYLGNITHTHNPIKSLQWCQKSARIHWFTLLIGDIHSRHIFIFFFLCFRERKIFVSSPPRLFYFMARWFISTIDICASDIFVSYLYCDYQIFRVIKIPSPFL